MGSRSGGLSRESRGEQQHERLRLMPSKAIEGGGGAGAGRSSPLQISASGFGGDSHDDMMDDEDDEFSLGGSSGGGVLNVAPGSGSSWDVGGGGSASGGLLLGSQVAPSQGSGGGGAGVSGGSSGGGSGSGLDARFFGEGREPGGALKGVVVWCARLSMAVRPNPDMAKRLFRIFYKVGVGWSGGYGKITQCDESLIWTHEGI